MTELETIVLDWVGKCSPYQNTKKRSLEKNNYLFLVAGNDIRK